ncbi:Uncharacterised protein [Vibrio cholerae]|nr:Uncharacterised protein [Vibrio cholerae]
MPVLPLVASMMVSPGCKLPRASACTIILSAGLSFTEPAGLLPSSFTNTVERPALRRCKRTKGV